MHPTVRFVLTGAVSLLATLDGFSQQVEFVPHVVRDAAAVHQEALTFLKPKGWSVTGGVKWYPNHTHQACLELKVTNPDGLEQVETLPWCYLNWVTNPVVPLQPGSNYLGNMIQQPLEDPREVIRQITLPTIRGNLNARITSYQEMPELARVLSGLQGGAKVRSGRIRLEYALNGHTVEEDFYLSLFQTSKSLGVNQAVSTLWGPAWPPFSLRAAKGELDAKTPMLLSIVQSAQVNPRWYAEYRFVCDQFQERMAKGIQNAVDLSNTIRANSDALFRLYSDGYRQRQESQDRLAQNYSQYIRGVELYQAPSGQGTVQLPNSHRYVWGSRAGGYVLSDDANFDPNQASGQNWSLLKKAK